MCSLRGEGTHGSGPPSLLSAPFIHSKMRPNGLFLLQTLHFVFANLQLKQSLHRLSNTDPECPAGTRIPVKLWDGPIQPQVTLTPSPPPLRPYPAHPACRTLWNLAGGVRTHSKQCKDLWLFIPVVLISSHSLMPVVLNYMAFHCSLPLKNIYPHLH